MGEAGEGRLAIVGAVEEAEEALRAATVGEGVGEAEEAAGVAVAEGEEGEEGGEAEAGLFSSPVGVESSPVGVEARGSPCSTVI